MSGTTGSCAPPLPGADRWEPQPSPRPFTIVRGAPLGPFPADPFSLGIASGAPREDRVVLWTRLAPQPLEGGGMPDERRRGRLAGLRGRDVLARSSRAAPSRPSRRSAHAVHAEAHGLRPGRHYWYRFRAGSAQSPIGRTRTAPAAGSQAVHDCASPLRLLPAVRAGLLRRLSRHGPARPRSRRASRRLHLRKIVGLAARAPARGRHSDHAAGVPRPLRALQARSAICTAAHAAVAMALDLG